MAPRVERRTPLLVRHLPGRPPGWLTVAGVAGPCLAMLVVLVAAVVSALPPDRVEMLTLTVVCGRCILPARHATRPVGWVVVTGGARWPGPTRRSRRYRVHA